MKNYMSNKQKPNYVMNSSFVLCSCSTQPPKGIQGDNKYEIENFEYYRVLKATDTNNGVYGGDNPIINEADCVPHINIAPFKKCTSKHYYRTVGEIADHASCEAEKYREGSAEYSYWYSKYRHYQDTLLAYNKKSGSYPCVLELLDSWFNTDDKTLMSNAIQTLEAAKRKQKDTYAAASTNLESMKAKLDEYSYEMQLELEKTAAESIETAEPGEWGKVIVLIDKPKNAPYPGEHYYVLSYAKTDSSGNVTRGYICYEKPVLDYEDFIKSDSYKDWKKDNDELNSIKTLISQLKDDIQDWKSSTVKTYVVSDDERTDRYDSTTDEAEKIYIDDIDVVLSEISSLRSKANRIIIRFSNYEEKAGKYKVKRFCDRLKVGFQGIYNELNDIYTEVESIRSEIYKRTTVTEDSFLVCRCGGVIKVIINGEWVQKSNDMVKPNLIDLLKYIEADLYRKYRPNDTADARYSVIDAFNMTHDMLLALSEQEQTNYDFIIDEGCENSGNVSPAIQIMIRPLNEALEEEKRVLGVLNAATFLPQVGPFIQLLLVADNVINFVNTSMLEKINDAEAFGAVLLGWFVDGNKIKELTVEAAEKFAKASILAGGYCNVISLYGAITNLLYQSYACFAGEIKVIVYTFKNQYTYRGRYDINGSKIEDYKCTIGQMDGSLFMPNTPRGDMNNIGYKIYDASYLQDS